MDRSSRQKISKAAEILNETIEQFDLIDIFRTLQPKKSQNTHSFQAHTEHSLGLITYYNKKQASANLRVQKLSQVSFLITMT